MRSAKPTIKICWQLISLLISWIYFLKVNKAVFQIV
uniref:Uncharacterized protein n=1 Tax=Anguilla anguilla TaxID=7936 RepID=A0A0E9PNK9_ANGAN